MANKFVGASHSPIAEFLDALGALYDPDTVTITVQPPSGIDLFPAVTHPSLGTFASSWVLDEAGMWFFEFVGSGPDGEVVVVRGSVCVLRALAEVVS